MTFTTIAQVPLAGIAPPLSDVEAAPVVAVTVPPQELNTSGLPGALTNPPGYVSINAALAEPDPPADVPSVIVICATAPALITPGENAFDTVAPFTTFRESVAAVPVPAFVVVIAPVLLT